MQRREFMKAVGVGAGVLMSGQFEALGEVTKKGDMPYRRFGRAKEEVSLLGVGGFHIGKCEEAEGIRIIQEAVDNGVNFMDNAICYFDGGSEERMGKALQGRREKAFIMTKHHGRDKATAMKCLEDSLQRLKTDRIDLWQYHECVHEKDPDMIFAKDGGIEAADLAKKQGKVRYIGFTGHKYPWIHLKMLAYEYPWDAVQMPLNVFDGSFQSFEQRVLPVLVKRGIAVLAMKTRGGGRILRTKACTIEDLWRYVTALPVSTVVSGMESLDMLRGNLKMARELKPMTAEEMAAIRKRTEKLALTGEHELYKTSWRYDSKAGRKLHGLL